MRTVQVRAEKADADWLKEIAKANDTTIAGAIKIVTYAWTTTASQAGRNRTMSAMKSKLPVRR